MPRLERTFDAVVFDWDGTAVPDRHAPARAIRRRVESLCARSVHVAVVSGTHVGNIDGQLRARPDGPGRLFLALNRGSELYAVDARGPRLVWRRTATRRETAALDAAASLVVAQLQRCGLRSAVVSTRLNRRKIDLIPEPEWADPPKARIAELLTAVTDRLHRAHMPDLSAVVALAQRAGKAAGLDDPRVTSDVKHVEIGLTDKSDSMRMLRQRLTEAGIGPGLTLVVGDEFGELGGVPGSDSYLLSPGLSRATVVSVGVEPTGPPTGVRHLPGGPRVFRALLDEQLRRRDHHRVPWVDEDPEWVLSVEGGDPSRVRIHETLLSLGDGVIGVRGSHEQPEPRESPLVLASGVYAGEGPAEHLLAGPWPFALDVTSTESGERQLLDLRTGVLARETGGRAPLRTMRFVAAGRRGAVAMRAEAFRGRMSPGPPLRQVTERSMTAGIRNGDAWARTTGEHGGITAVARQLCTDDGRWRAVQRVTTYVTDHRRPPPVNRASALLERLDRLGFERLLAQHRATWAARWAGTDVSIPDDPQTQLAVRFALFQLWNNVATHGEAAVGARGLSGPGYAGHVFWDTDVFVLPAMLTMSPAAARAVLEYRIRRLPPARMSARLRGLDGARFPWESSAEGYDVTPMFGRANGEWVPIFTGQLEEHIVADVAWAACRYSDWTGDVAFLTGPGRPLVTDTARYWASRIWTGDDGRGHIRHVIGPDEYHEDVDDNAYTNVLARWNLRRAAALDPSSPDVSRWLRLADALVDGYDPTTHRHEQFAHYYELEPLLVADIGSPPLAADLLLGADRVSRSQIVKQPDVLMAHHLVPADLPCGSLAADLDYYLPRTAHGSSLSPAIAASLLAQAGRADDALALLDIALRLDLDDLTGMTSSGLHLATLAGVWQALLFGFAGVQVRAGRLRLDPHLPSHWSSLGLRFHCLGRRIALQVAPDVTTVVVSRPLPVETSAGEIVHVTRQACLRSTSRGWVVDC